jgi:PST family polysaccharide transporter
MGTTRKKLMQDAGFLYGAHFFRYLFPFIILPFLARTLGPERYGLLLIAMSVSGLVGIIVEFGFNLSATRDIAAAPPGKLSDIVGSIFTAKAFLAALAVPFGVATVATVDALRTEPWFGACGILLGVVQGANLSWYFRGTDRMAIAVVIEFAAQVLNIGLLFLLVHGPQDAVLVLVAQIVAIAAVQLCALAAVARETGVRFSSLHRGTRVLKEGLPIFIQHASWATYATASCLVLGWFSTPEQVGYFGSADKFVNAGLQLMNPLLALLFTYVTRSLMDRPEAARTVLRITVATLTIAAAAAAMLNAIRGPTIASLILGKSFDQAGPVLIVLGLILPFCAVGQSLAMLLLIPTRNDRLLTKLLILGAMVNLSSAVILAPAYGAIGMAVSRVLAEISVTIVMLLMIARCGIWRDLAPQGRATKRDEGAPRGQYSETETKSGLA